jgi:hypothetical protein
LEFIGRSELAHELFLLGVFLAVDAEDRDLDVVERGLAAGFAPAAFDPVDFDLVDLAVLELDVARELFDADLAPVPVAFGFAELLALVAAEVRDFEEFVLFFAGSGFTADSRLVATTFAIFSRS